MREKSLKIYKCSIVVLFFLDLFYKNKRNGKNYIILFYFLILKFCF